MVAGLMAFLALNTTETIGAILTAGSNTTTGDMIVTLLILMILLIAMAVMFGIPMEFTALIIFPYSIVCIFAGGQFIAVSFILALYFVFLIVKRWIFR
jgi:hypothetical protein